MADLSGATRKIGKKVDHSGRRVGMLVAITPATNAPNRGARWHCRCDCGSEAIVPAESLVRGKSRSCGCSSNKFRSEKLTRHGQSRSVNGVSGSYRSWHAAMQRCTNPKSRYFANYGGRGIQFCERWRLFDNFFEDMGQRPEGQTLDRIDPNGNDEPGNCKWSTPREQSLNQRRKVRNDDIADLLAVAKRILSAGSPFEDELAKAINKFELRRLQ